MYQVYYTVLYLYGCGIIQQIINTLNAPTALCIMCIQPSDYISYG